MKNTEGLKKHNEALSAEKEKAVKSAINKLRKKDYKFSLTDVCREAGVSRQYLHKHPDLLELVYKYTSTTTRGGKRNKDSTETYITILKADIREKDREIARIKKEYEVNENYKAKYEDALQKIKQLEQQLEEAYSLNLPTKL